MFIMLKGSWTGNMPVPVRDENGNLTEKSYTFSPGIPVLVSDEDIPQLKKLIANKILLPVEIDKTTNKPTIVDIEFTDEPTDKKPPKKPAKPADDKK